MITVNMHEAKTNLSSLINSLDKEEKILICNNGTPVAELIPHKIDLGKRIPGGYPDIVMHDNFEWTEEDLKEMFPYLYDDEVKKSD